MVFKLKKLLKNRCLVFAILILLIISFFGCKVKENAVRSSPKYLTTKHILKNLSKARPEINTLWIKSMSIKVKDERNSYLGGNLRMIRDSLIIFGISSKIGIEGVRIILSPDTLIVMNRINKTFFKESTNNISLWGLDHNLFFSLQFFLLDGGYDISNDLLKNFDKGERIVVKNGMVCLVDSKKRYVYYGLRSGSFEQYCLYASSSLPGSLVYTTGNKEKLFLLYDKYLRINDVFYPGSMAINLEGNINRAIHLQVKKIELNSRFPTKYKINTKYFRVKSLRNL